MFVWSFNWGLPLAFQAIFLCPTAKSQEEPLPKFLQDMIDAYRAKNFPNANGTTEYCPTIDPDEYLYGRTSSKHSGTTHYLDRYPTAPMDITFLSAEVNMFTMFPHDGELVYTGPTMDPNDLLGLELGNTDGWRHFELDGKHGPLFCPICKKKFLKENKYYDHLLLVENMTTPIWFVPTFTCSERYKATPVTCPDHLCRKECKNFGYLRLHLLEEHNGLPHNWNLTSDEYIRPVVKKNQEKERSEYVAVLMNSTRRSYVRRSNVTRARRTRVTRVTNATRLKRKYKRKQNATRLPRRLSTLDTKMFSIIDEDFGKNLTGWQNEYPG